MTILIKGAKRVPLWDTLDRVISEALDTRGHLTRIARRDGTANYTKPGLYQLTFTPFRNGTGVNGHPIDVTLDVQE